MTTINDVLPSRWLGVEDLHGREKTVTIRRFVMEKIAGQDKPVLYLNGEAKGWIINRTVAVSIGKLYGDTLENWHGKSITLFSTEVKAYGSMWPVIRVKPVRPAMPATNGQPAREAEPLVPDYDPDEVSDLADEDEGIPPTPTIANAQEAVNAANAAIAAQTGDMLDCYGKTDDAVPVLKAAGFKGWPIGDAVKMQKVIDALVKHGISEVTEANKALT